MPVRLLALALPADIAAAKRRRKLKEARDKSRTISETKVFYLGVVVLVTTLEQVWTAEEIFQVAPSTVADCVGSQTDQTPAADARHSQYHGSPG